MGAALKATTSGGLAVPALISTYKALGVAGEHAKEIIETSEAFSTVAKAWAPKLHGKVTEALGWDE